MTPRRSDVAVVGMACRYPGAASPRELWENALAGRRAFRRIPRQRLRLEDYAGDGPDSIYLRQAAVLEDWQLDRVAFRIAGASWRAADHAHWLALEVAARALDDAGVPGGEGLDREGTGVLVGNSLTGEFSRAGLMRLRWPYVRRTVAAELAAAGWEEERRRAFLATLEERYKEPFPEPGEETLAGGLANTIAGRIANHFDFHGGGYTVDGACASSLLAVAQACSALVAGDLEVAVAGGVDLSLDPFELVGFSRTGAFARGPMRVYDERSGGFLPGEGCGMVVLMPLASALRRGRRVHAVIRGWGVSSDGAGGLTRPSSRGQLLALSRAYRRAGFAAATVDYFEGHGTGTAVGDPVELEALAAARQGGAGEDDKAAAGPDGPGAGRRTAAVGSVKTIIGHTKAAAGVAGLLKAVMAVREGVLPPTIGCESPHPVLADTGAGTGPPPLRTLERAEPWPRGVPRRAGVSAFGFGGINAHLVLEAAEPDGDLSGRGVAERTVPAAPESRSPWAGSAASEAASGVPVPTLPDGVRRLDVTRQDAELLLLVAADRPTLAAAARELAARAEGLSEAELTDLAVASAAAAEEALGGYRGSVVAARPEEAAQRLRELAAALEGAEDGEAAQSVVEPAGLWAAGPARRAPRVGFLFPGQGVPGRARGDGLFAGAWARRFPAYEAALRRADLPDPGAVAGSGGVTATDVVQPALVAASLAARSVVEGLGLHATVAVGHSLGELSALAWAGVWSGDAVVRLARARGAAMAAVPGDGGAMAGLSCDAATAADLVDGTGAVLAGLNGPRQTVVSGPLEAVDEVAGQARLRGVAATRLAVSHAFHSPAMAAAAPALATALGREAPAPPRRRVVSTVTGAEVSADADIATLLGRQLTAPVLFTRALQTAEADVDLWVEVGPGRVVAELARRAGGVPAVSLDAGGASLAGLLAAIGTAWAMGARLEVGELFRERFHRPLRAHAFLASPCEAAPFDEALPTEPEAVLPAPAPPGPAWPAAAASGAASRAPSLAEPPPEADPLALVRRLVAERAELPPEAVGPGDRLLSDLHLSSIAVGQLVVEAARRVGAPPPASPTDYADASVGEIAEALAGRAGTDPGAAGEAGPPPGVDAWVRAFRRRWVAAPLPGRPSGAPGAKGEPPVLPQGTAGEGAEAQPPGRLRTFHLSSGEEPAAVAFSATLGKALRGERLEAGAVPAGADLLLLHLPASPGAADLERLLAVAKAALPAAGPPPTWADGAPAAGSVHEPAGDGAGRPPVGHPAAAPTASGSGTTAKGKRPAVPRLPRLVLLHHGAGAGFVRSLHLERPEGEVVVIGLPPMDDDAEVAALAAALAAELAAEAVAPVPSGGYREVMYDADGRRHVPRLEVVPLVDAGELIREPAAGAPLAQASASDVPEAGASGLPLGAGDVLLVTGGGRGIAAECALDLARESGAALVLLGRSRPDQAPDLAENLERFAAAGVSCRYLRADVTDGAAVAAAVAEAERELGSVTAVLHGAGRNRPRLVAALTADDVERTRAVKVDGLEHVLAAVDAGRLRLLVAFGSIIAEMGVRGEADYALANELLARRVEAFAAAHPACRCLTAEWSVWSGVGMGERLGTLESLRAQGISPISPDRGVEELRRLLARPGLPPTLVVAGRFGEPPTLNEERPELPFLRFLESPRVHVPGVELVVETEVSDASDPYLADHVFDGDRLFPAVLGLEAMAQVATALAGRQGGAEGRRADAAGRAATPGISFEAVRFERPIAVPAGERVVLRVAALVRGPGRVEVTLRSSATGFQLDHFAAVCRLHRAADDPVAGDAAGVLAAAPPEDAAEPIALDPRTDLYGGILFHSGRFRRLAGYHLLRSTRCVAEIAPAPEGTAASWFARHLPASLLLGDPGARDAVIHGVQASIPHATVLPTGVEELLPGHLDAGAAHRVVARERSRDGRDLVYDLEVLDRDGRRVEAWPLPLLAPHVERRLGDLVRGARPSVAFTAAGVGGGEDRRAASDRAVAAAAGGPVVRFRRPDGRRLEAETGGGRPSGTLAGSGDGGGASGSATLRARGGALSVAHGPGVVMAVVGGWEAADRDSATARRGAAAEHQPEAFARTVGCDLEEVVPRSPEVWRGLLGSRVALAEHLAAEAAASNGHGALDVAATRVWAAVEALKKAGQPVDAPLTFVSATADGWVLLASGPLRVAVLVAGVGGSVRDAGAAPPAPRTVALAVALPAGSGEEAAGGDRLRAS